MKVTLSGEAYTDSACPLCKSPHRMMSDRTAEQFKKLGFTDQEIQDIKTWAEQEYRELHTDLASERSGDTAERPEISPGDSKPKPPSHMPEATKARVAAWRAKQRAGRGQS